jgi:alanine dehydrogenase
VKEPIKSEWPRMRRGLTIFTYFLFSADEEHTRAHRKRGAV